MKIKLTGMVLFLIASNAFSSVVLTSTAAVVAAHHRQQQAKKQRHDKMIAKHAVQSGSISGVLICNSANTKKVGYYGHGYSSCYFWDEEHGDFVLSLQEIYAKYLPEKVIYNVFFDYENDRFEIYYGEP